MITKKKSRLILTAGALFSGVLWLFLFLGIANPGAVVSVAAVGPTSYNIFLPLVMNNFPLPIIPTVFGVELHSINSGGGLNQMAAAKTSWVRRNAVIWSSIEPIEGDPSTYNWSSIAGLETELKNAYNNGMQVILIVRSTPGWARKDGNAVQGPSCGPIAQNKWAAFGTFMNALVARYSVAPYNVKYWEIWNEEDGPYISGDNIWGCWGDTSDVNYGGGYYAGMLQVAYPQIKAADPQAKVLIGGLLLDCDPRPGAGCAIVGHDAKQSLFLEGRLKTSNIGSFFDGISFHAYDYYQGWAGFYSNKNWLSSGLANAANTQDWATTIGPVSIAKAQYITSLLSEYGVSGKFLMNTELAILDYCPNNICTGGTTFENTKAYYIAQVYAAAIAQGLRANTWYDVFGWDGSGLLDGSLNPYPAYTAFKFGRNELRDSTYLNGVSKSDVGGVSNVKGYKFQRGDRRIWILWSVDGNAHTIKLSSIPLAAWDALGVSVTPVKSMSVTVDPLYLEWNP